MTLFLLQAAALALAPVLLVGIVNRVKSAWSGRRGVPVLQLFYDVARLIRKKPVYSEVSTGLVRWSGPVTLGAAALSGFMLPLLGPAPVSFPFDFVLFAYAWGLGRVFLMLGAMDTGSSFEGMGASREAAYAALIEPAFFLAVGALGSAAGASSLSELLRFRPDTLAGGAVWAGSFAALFVLLQVEAARIPVDDPSTHLELTMVHEVMVLDHSGPDLAAIQFAAALKLTLCAGILATMANPADPTGAPVLFAALNAALMAFVAVAVGTVESISARLKLRAVPQYILAAIMLAFVSALSSTLLSGAGG